MKIKAFSKVFFKLIVSGMLAMIVMAGCSNGKNGGTGKTGTQGTQGTTGPLASAPVITGLNPTTASFNTVITITGLNFTTTLSNMTVYCDSAPAMLVSATPTQLTITGCGKANVPTTYQAKVSVLTSNQMSNGFNEWIVASGSIMQFPAASLTGPQGIVSGNGKLYVADYAGVFAVDNATGWTTKILPAGCSTCTLAYPGGITMDNSGNLIVTDFNNSTLIGINPTTSETWYILGPGNGFLSGPWGVTYANGYVYVADYTSGAITQVNYSNLQAANLSLAPALAGAPVDIADDGSGNLYVTTESAGGVSKIVVSGTSGTVTNNYVTGVPSGSGISGINISGTSLLITEYSDQALYTAPIGGGAASKMCADFSPWETHYNSSIIPDGSGGLFVGDTDDGLVYHVNSACNVSTYAAGIGYPYDMTYLNGDFYIPNNWFDNNTYGDPVLEVRSDGAMRVFAQVPGGIEKVAVNPSGGLTIAAYNNNTVYTVSSSGTVSTLIPSSAGLNGPSGLAYDNTGNLYIANYNNSTISKWNGGITLIFATGVTNPYGMIVNNGVLYMTSSWASSKVYSVNISTGGAASVYLPTSVGLSVPESLGVDIFGNLLVENYSGNNGFFRVDAQKHVTVLVSPSVTIMSAPNGIAIPPSQLIYTVEENGLGSRMWVIAP